MPLLFIGLRTIPRSCSRRQETLGSIVNIPVGVAVVRMSCVIVEGCRCLCIVQWRIQGGGGAPVREQSVLLPILNLTIHLLYSIEEYSWTCQTFFQNTDLNINISIKVQASEM